MQKELYTHNHIIPGSNCQQKFLDPKTNGHLKSSKTIYESGEWFRIHNLFFDKYASILGVYPTAVYTYISRKANNSKKQANPCIDTIAKTLNMSKGKVVQSIKHLTFWNIIRKIATPRNESNKYEMVSRDKWKIPPVNHVEDYKKSKSRVSRGDTPVCHVVTSKKIKEEDNTKKEIYKEKDSFEHTTNETDKKNKHEHNNNGHKNISFKGKELNGSNGNGNKVEISTNGGCQVMNHASPRTDKVFIKSLVDVSLKQSRNGSLKGLKQRDPRNMDGILAGIRVKNEHRNESNFNGSREDALLEPIRKKNLEHFGPGFYKH